MGKVKFDFIPHTADLKFLAYGKTKKELFENSALALTSVISRGIGIKSEKKKSIKVKGNDDEALLYNFLEEILFFLDSENFIVAKTKVKISKNFLEAELIGDKTDNYKALDHIKAITYNEMYVKKAKIGWESQVVLDV